MIWTVEKSSKDHLSVKLYLREGARFFQSHASTPHGSDLLGQRVMQRDIHGLSEALCGEILKENENEKHPIV